MNKAYLNSIRENSCYPTFRAFVTGATVLAYIVAALVVIVGFKSSQGNGILIGAVAAVLIVLIGKVGQEVSLMIADIADATIDSSRHRTLSKPLHGSQNKPLSADLSSETLENYSEVPATEVSTGQMGVCPNCKSVIPLASETCNKCKAFFGAGSAWEIKPLP